MAGHRQALSAGYRAFAPSRVLRTRPTSTPDRSPPSASALKLHPVAVAKAVVTGVPRSVESRPASMIGQSPLASGVAPASDPRSWRRRVAATVPGAEVPPAGERD